MDLVKKEVELPKESNELAEGVCNLVLKVKEALKDGFQIGEDLPVIVAAAVSDLVSAVDGIDKIDDELKESAYKFGLVWAIAGEKVFESFMEKEEE